MADPAPLPVLPRRPRTDYIAPPSRIANRTTARRRGWYAGWPDACPPTSARTTVVLTRPSDAREFRLQIDDRLATLFATWATMFQELGHELRGAGEPSANGKLQGGVGSYVCRAIKGSEPPRPSNHSTGTAWDLWTRSNPQIWTGAFVSTIHPEVVELAAAADIYWGGWYWDARRDYVDAMHFEYMARPGDVTASLTRLKAKYAEIVKRHEPDEPDEEGDVTPEQVKALQANLNAVGTQPPLVVDGVYGPMTEAAVAGLPTLVVGQVDSAETSASAQTKQAAIEAVAAIPVEPTA
jgi:hypothetical protein